jgi:hypothetical protein
MSVFTNPATGAAENAAAYTSAVLELLGDREPTAALREMPFALPRAVEGLSSEQLREPERPGKWSIGQILQHLADSEVVWAWRMRLILAQDRPRLTGGTERVGVHAERGEESLEHLIRLYAGHDLLHLRQIARVRRAVA